MLAYGKSDENPNISKMCPTPLGVAQKSIFKRFKSTILYATKSKVVILQKALFFFFFFFWKFCTPSLKKSEQSLRLFCSFYIHQVSNEEKNMESSQFPNMFTATRRWNSNIRNPKRWRGLSRRNQFIVIWLITIETIAFVWFQRQIRCVCILCYYIRLL